MKVLLDESVPQKLRLFIDEVESVETTAFRGWSGLKNGALLDAAEHAGFDLFITADQELEYQQNVAGRRLAVVLLSTNNWAVIHDHVADILRAIKRATQGRVEFVDIGYGRG